MASADAGSPDIDLKSRVYAFDWSKTPLGPMSSWPRPLRAAVDMCICSRLPMFVSWGPELIKIYNDAYASVLGKRHPGALGQSARLTWADIWPQIGAEWEGVMTAGVPVLRERSRIVMERNGYSEETFFTRSDSPILDEQGSVGGLLHIWIDETARVQAEHEEEMVGQQRQLALDAAKMGWWRLDATHKIASFDRRYAEIYGLAKNRLTFEELFQQVHPDDREGFIKGSEAAMDPISPKPYSGLHRIVRADGSVRWIETHGTATFEGEGEKRKPVQFVGTVADVTERNSADTEMRENSALIRSITDTTGDVIFAKDREGRLRFANPATLKLFGKPLEEVIGKTDIELLGDKAAAQTVMDNDRQIMERGAPADVEEHVPMPDGRHRIWLSRKIPNRAPDGKVVGLLGVSRDITEQKRNWERIGRLYSVAAKLSEATTPDEVARATVEQGIAAVGASAGSLALLTEDGQRLELVGTAGYALEAIGPWKVTPLNAAIPLAEAVRTGEPVFITSPEDRQARFPAITALQSTQGTQSSATIPLKIGGRAVGSLGLSFSRPGAFSAEDREFMMSLGRQCAQALERARLFEGERRARTEAEHASGVKDEFLATLSHELRTPLNAILGWATILSGKTPSETELKSGLEKILRNAREQTRLVEDLLDMSRIINGNLRLEVQRTDLVQVLQAALDTIKPAAEAKGVRIRAVLDSHGGPVSGDPGRLQQVFWNLLHNAVKFTPRGGQVQVVLQQVNSHLEVRVADTGEGIPPDFLPHIFSRFRQADATSTRRHGGLGLGLAIVKQLIELHGGVVRAQSPGLEKGATFTVDLPLAVIHEAPFMPPRSTTSAEQHASLNSRELPRLVGVRAVVLDDDSDSRLLVKRLLEDSEATVRAAASPDEAMQLILAEKPDILVSDVGMPGEDGYSFLRRVRALEGGKGDMPAVALTAYARTDDRVRALRAGFQSHVVKPVEAVELIAVVASLTKRN